MSSKEFRQNWARLIQRIYRVDPLLCPHCLGSMKIISFIQDDQLAKKILKHLDLWEVKRKPAPCANSLPAGAAIIYDACLTPSADDYIIDAGYLIETYLKKILHRQERSAMPELADFQNSAFINPC